MPDPLVQFEKVSYFYPDSTDAALFDLDLEIRRGEIVGIMGPTGSGKSTLCLAFNGIVPQFQGGRFFGTVRVAGWDSTEQPIHVLARHVSMTFQDPETQLVTSNVADEVAFTLENLALEPDLIRRRVQAALSAVGLWDLRDRHPHELSGGQQQRLALAAALAVEPDLIVLDEPTSQLDPRSAHEVFGLIRRLNAEKGIAFVVTGHASEEMAETAHRVVVLDGGRIVASDRAEIIYRDAALLRRVGVRAPEVSAIFEGLARRGCFAGEIPVRLAAGLEAIRTLPPAKILGFEDRAIADRNDPLLAISDLGFTYPSGTPALQGVTLTVGRGEYLLLIGQNGSGKSTLLKHLLGLLRPESGEVRLGGRKLSELRVAEIAQRIGYVPQNPDRQLFNSTVEAEVGFALKATRLPEEEKARRLDAALTAMRLHPLRQRHPFSLSKGDRARVVIAAVLVMEPEILVFDEPTTGQDDRGARAILDLTRELHTQGRTIMMVTHHLALVAGYASRAVVLHQGRVLLDGRLREVYHAIDTLRQSALEPTQAVALVHASNPDCRAVSVAEAVEAFSSP